MLFEIVEQIVGLLARYLRLLERRGDRVGAQEPVLAAIGDHPL
jgi:hypothetical protein